MGAKKRLKEQKRLAKAAKREARVMAEQRLEAPVQLSAPTPPTPVSSPQVLLAPGSSVNAGEIPFAHALARLNGAEFAGEYFDAARTMGDAIQKANPLVDENQRDTPKGVYWDPFALVEQLGYRDRTGSASFATLDAVVWRVPIVHDIIQTRLTEISVFCTPIRDRFSTGYRIKLRDPDAHPKSAEKKEMKRLTQALESCNTYKADSRGRVTFDHFIRQLMRDSLTYDQMAAEIVPARNGKPAEWYAIDASSLRLANTTKLYPVTDPDEVFAVQVYNNVVIEQFTPKELAWGIRNPRTSLRGYGYGIAETEMIISAITYILWGLHYNANFFKYGSSAKGLLNLVGQIPETQLRSFRTQFYQMLAGVENSWRTPITNVERLEWINMHPSNRDMEFSSWLDFLIKIVCACFAINPAQINFSYGNSGGSKVAFESSGKEKTADSRQQGLRPLLRFVERFLNKNIVQVLNDEFEFEFVGLDAMSPKEMADLTTQRVRTIETIDELRAEQDKPPLPDGLGKVILDANWMNTYRMNMQKKDADEQQEKAENELYAHAAAMAALPEGQVSDEEIATLVQAMLTNGQQPSGATGGPGGPPPGGLPTGGGGPGGGKAGSAPIPSSATSGLPKPPNPEAASGMNKLGKSLTGVTHFKVEL